MVEISRSAIFYFNGWKCSYFEISKTCVAPKRALDICTTACSIFVYFKCIIFQFQWLDDLVLFSISMVEACLHLVVLPYFNG